MSIAQHGETTQRATHRPTIEELLAKPNPFRQVEPYTITVRDGDGQEVTVSFDLEWTYQGVPVQIKHQRRDGAPLDIQHLLLQAAMSLQVWAWSPREWAPELRPAGPTPWE